MFVEGTLRWQVTEDCPWDLLMALAVRDLAGLGAAGDPVLPRLTPALAPVLRANTGSHPVHPSLGGGHGRSARRVPGVPGEDPLAEQWRAWFEVAVDRERRPAGGMLRPPHFEAFDRALELQDVVIEHYDVASTWAHERHAEYVQASLLNHARRAADIVDVVREREHELRRQAGYFRLDIDVLPLSSSGAWIVGPHTVVVSASLRDDSGAFRDWFRPLVSALV
ncbi:hypothetical protein IT072_09490 [Leifsonia sp. ZF2019]|uniref:hypothetical protein n=1 Tax=Leifsonia sp. ZF2019 TaxID=2781978 RepID=UPI001CC020CF|nr:hypothetical protein [Leifsonia sp. ZF2019]UAJ81186.1 hypothetical protein IT072_09490 [Leifsonia sp. ZF2019]